MQRFHPLQSSLTAGALALLAAGAGVGCDASQKGQDAAAVAGRSTGLAEIAVRVDVPSGGAPSVSVLAFRAAATGLAPDDVLGVVDPVVAAPPESGCVLRDVAGAARALGAQGGRVELEALSHLAVDVAPGVPALRPAPRVYPELASVVGGVVAEAGPVDVPAAPTALTLFGPDGRPVRSKIPVPVAARLLGADGAPLEPGMKLDPARDLLLQIQQGPDLARPFLELRPFGATMALACAPDPTGRVTVPADQLGKLARASGRVPVSVEAVWRDAQILPVSGRNARLSVEVRSSAVVELGP
jgi:hypothetical protein